MKRVFWIFALLMLASAFAFAGGAREKGGTSGNTTASGTSSVQSAAPYQIKYAIVLLGAQPEKMDLVENAINKIIEPKIGATLKFLPISVGNYSNQTNLMMAGGEKLDLMTTGYILNFAANAAKGEFTPMGDLLEKYGRGVTKAVGPVFLKVGMVNGKQYAVPPNKDFGNATGVAMRKDLVDKYKIDVSKVRTLDELGNVLRKIKAAQPDLIPLAPFAGTNSIVGYLNTWDILGDTLGVLMNYGDNLKVTNLYDTQVYASMVEKVHSWYQEGLIQPDAATTKEAPSALVKAGRAFGYVTVVGAIRTDSNNTNLSGQPMVHATLTRPFATTSTASGLLTAIPYTTKNAVKTMEFLNLMYTDPQIVNLMEYGVRGVHYIVLPNGQYDYAPGAKPSLSMKGIGWQYTNMLLSGVWKGDSPTVWQDVQHFNDTVQRSKALGFVFNPESVKTELTACNNVLQQYRPGLETGALDPATALPKFQAALRAAGINKIIAEKQKQLNAWAAANGVK